MAQDANEILVAARGNIFLADPGTDLPEDLEPLSSDYKDLGLSTEEGVSFVYSEARTEIKAWQRAQAVRRIVTGRDLTTTYQLEQWNRDTLALAMGGGAWTEPTSDVFRYDPPDQDDPSAEYTQVVDFVDGDKHGRLVIPKGGVNEDVQTSLVRTAASILPVAFKALAADEDEESSWYFLSNDVAFEVGS